jgi:hypothetical protein
LVSVRAWVDGFVEWYNTEHRHSGIKYVTPNQRHYGQADAICAIRRQTYEQAFLLNPQRWTQDPRDWSQPEVEKSTILDQCNLQLLEPNKPRPPWLLPMALLQSGIGNSHD